MINRARAFLERIVKLGKHDQLPDVGHGTFNMRIQRKLSCGIEATSKQWICKVQMPVWSSFQPVKFVQ